jgi:hypothetical protein
MKGGFITSGVRFKVVRLAFVPATCPYLGLSRRSDRPGEVDTAKYGIGRKINGKRPIGAGRRASRAANLRHFLMAKQSVNVIFLKHSVLLWVLGSEGRWWGSGSFGWVSK